MSARVMRRVRVAAAPGDAGVTLTELIVAMTLSVILGAITLSLFVNIDTSSATTTDRTINTASARNALQAWTEYIGVADGYKVTKDDAGNLAFTPGSRDNRIEWLTANDMVFHADLFNRTMADVGTTQLPTIIWLRRDSEGELVEEQFADGALDSPPRPPTLTVCRVLVTGVTGTQPLFTPLASRGGSMAGLDLGTAPATGPGCQPLPSLSGNADTAAEANLQNVYSITIDFVVADNRNSHPIEFTSQAVLPALGGGA